MKKLRVLVTCGATWAAIDEVRVISNISSGEMGHLIAGAFRTRGANVTLIEGPVTHQLKDKKIKVIKYNYFDELAIILEKEASTKYDIVVLAAAVSDFKVAVVNSGKIDSDKSLTLKLLPTPKLIQDIKRLSPDSFLVGFKLESSFEPGAFLKELRSLFVDSWCDLVVANSLNPAYKGYIVNADGDILAEADKKQGIAQSLVKICC